MKCTQIREFVSTKINFAIAAMAASGLMTLVACSSAGKAAQAPNRAGENTASQAAPAQQPETQSAAMPLLKPVSAVSHTVAHRGPLATFRDSDFGISMQYPWQYGFKGGHKLRVKGEETVNGFVAAGGVNLATIEIPAGYYEKTDFERAFLTVNVNRKLTAEQCSQFQAAEALTPVKTKIADADAMMIEQTGDNSVTRTYHTSQNGACYEFVLGFETKDGDGSDQGEAEQVKPVSQKQVFARLEKMLETVQIDEAQDGTAVASAPAGADVPPQPKQ